MKKLTEKISRGLNLPKAGFEKYFKNTMWLFGEKSATMLLGLAVGLAVARYLGPADYGIISYGVTMLIIAAQSSALGIDDLIIRDAINRPQDEGKIFGTAFICRAAASLVFFAVCAAFSYFTADKNNFLPILIITACVLTQPVNILSQFFQMKVNVRPMTLANMCGHTVSAAVKIVLIAAKAPVIYFAFAMFIDYALAMALAAIFYKKSGYSFKSWRFDGGTALYLFKTGWPLALVAVLGIIYARAGVIILNALEGSAALGTYTAAARLTEVWFDVPSVIAASLFPAIINSKKDSDQYISRIEKILALTAAGSAALAVFVTFASAPIVSLLYGARYSGAASALSIYIWSLLFVSLNVITAKWLMTENHIMLNLTRTAASLAVNIALSFLMIKKYGIEGAAAAAVMSYAFYAYFVDIFSKKTRGLFIIKTKAVFFPAVFLWKKAAGVKK